MVSNESFGIDSSKLTGADRAFVDAILCVWETNKPSLSQIWAILDFVWRDMGGNKFAPEKEMLERYYRHPVWALNGLFIEQHSLSLQNREIFSEWVRELAPSRVADFGGGFGALGRMIAAKCPATEVHIVDPFPHQLALERLSAFPKASFLKELDGSYDIILATDVFEHVEDPLKLAASVSGHIPVGGRFMMANDFRPTIECHLPVTFHFRSTWHFFMTCLGFRAERPVSYGWSYLKSRQENLTAARRWESLSRATFKYRRRIALLDHLVERLSLGLARRPAC